MIKKNQSFINAVNMLLDAALAFCTCWALLPKMGRLGAGTFALSFWLLLALQGFYNTDRLYLLRHKAMRIVVGGLLAVFVLPLLFYQRAQRQGMEDLLLLFLFSSLLLVGKYACMRLLLNQLRERGWNIKHVAVIGTGAAAARYAMDAGKQQQLGYQVIGFIGLNRDGLPAPLLCGFDELGAFLHDTDVDEVVVALEPDEATRLREIILLCEQNGVRYSLIPFEADLLPRQIEVSLIGGTQLLSPRRSRLDIVGWSFIKRAFDIVLSAAGIVVLGPLMCVIALGVKLSGPGPVLFRQERVGYNRRHFQMLKFRTMRPNAEENSAWTTDSDPRRTRFGEWLRKLSLDELPQLFNVLTGSMSLVGPRPELPVFVEQFRSTFPRYMLKHQVRPGITGWAQVNGLRGDTSLEDRIRCDLWYIENWTPLLDLRILYLTLFGGMVNRERLSSGLWDRAVHVFRKRVFPAAAILTVLSCIGYYTLRYMYSADILKEFFPLLLYRICIACSLIVILGVLFEKKSFPLRALFWNLIWVVLSRCVLGSLLFYKGDVFLCALFCCAVFASSEKLDHKSRELLWILSTLELAIIMTSWAIPGIGVALTGNSVDWAEGIALRTEWQNDIPLVTLRFFREHRNLSAMFFVIAAGMLLSQCPGKEKRFWKAASVILLPLWFAAASLQHSRSSNLSFAVLLSLALMLTVRGRSGEKRHTARAGAFLCLLALCVILSYCSFDLCSDAISSMSLDLREQTASVSVPEEGDAEEAAQEGVPEETEQTNVPEITAQTSAPEEAMTVTDSRSLIQDTWTLSGRVKVWHGFLKVLIEHPEIALFGQKEKVVMKLVNQKAGTNVSHLHNILFQQLMIAGIPGLLLYVQFLFSLLKKMAMCLLQRGKKEARKLQLVASVLLGILTNAVFEPLMSARLPLTSVLFCLTAGYFSGSVADLGPDAGPAPVIDAGAQS